MPGKQVTELDALPSFTDTSLLPVHNGAGLKKGRLSQLASYLGTKFSNPNLLINPDFKINQRGATSYTTGYTVDRWRVTSATLDAKTKVLSNSNSASGTFLQSLENKPTGTFTVTLNVASFTGTVKFSWKDGSTYKTGVAISKGLNTYTFTASSLTWVGIDIASGASIQLDYMKLEKGTVATSFIAPNMAEELDKCLRYFQTYENIAFIPELLSVSDVSKSATNYVPLYMIFAQQMRVKPTATYKSIINRSGTVISGNHSITVDNKGLTGLKLSSSSTYHTIYANKLTLDAEIY